jgi:hypothetical protein
MDGLIAGYGQADRFSDLPAVNIQAGMRVFSVTRNRCYLCDPEHEEDCSYRNDCQDSLHAVYSSGYLVGVMQALIQAGLVASSAAESMDSFAPFVLPTAPLDGDDDYLPAVDEKDSDISTRGLSRPVDNRDDGLC